MDEQKEKLTTQEFWESYWDKGTNTVEEIKREKKNLYLNEILDVFDKYLPVNENYSVLEIGGAPGKYLMYLYRTKKYKANSLDYSHVGNVYTESNFKNAGIPVTVYERDLFGDVSDLPKFDIVYSLGFIEHFDDPLIAVNKHLELLKPGGILLLGVPNLGGIYKVFLKKLAPKLLGIHNLNTMNIKNWRVFEDKLPIAPVFVNYTGGFEPMVMKKKENKDIFSQTLYRFITGLYVIFSHNFRFLRKYNSKFWSGYLIGVYKKNI